VEPIADVAGRRTRVSRRWLLMGTTAVVAAAAMLTAVAIHVVGYPDSERPDAILGLAGQFFEDDWDQSAAGRLLVEAAPHRDYSISPHVLQGNWVRWREVSEFLDRRGVAYELTRPGGPRATLYVVKYPEVALPSRPPRSPASTTHNRSTSAWQDGTLLFVLVVEGGPQTYRGYLNLPSGPVT
jgi:hypothetical protein